MGKSIQLLFSGASSLNAEQIDTNISIGGYISSSVVPKSLVNGIFPELSVYDLANFTPDTFAVFLKNNGTEDIPSISLLQVYDDNICRFEWAVVAPSEGGFIESLGSKKETPYYAEFFEPDVATELLSATLEPGKSIGLWIRRTLIEVEDSCTYLEFDSKKENLEVTFTF